MEQEWIYGYDRVYEAYEERIMEVNQWYDRVWLVYVVTHSPLPIIHTGARMIAHDVYGSYGSYGSEFADLKRATAKTQIAYFTNWGIYAANFREFHVWNVCVSSDSNVSGRTHRHYTIYTHSWVRLKVLFFFLVLRLFTDILYAFADVNPDSAVISLTDVYADEAEQAGVLSSALSAVIMNCIF